MFGIEQWAQGSHPFFVQHPSLTNYVIGFIVLLGLAKKVYRGQPIFCGYPAVGLLVFTYSCTLCSGINTAGSQSGAES